MPIRYEKEDAVAWATFDRPQVLNALDIPDLEDLLGLFGKATADEAVRVLVVTGLGRAFSVGADIKAMDRMSEIEFGRAAALYQALARAARLMDKPVIAAINGYALGGGLEIALMCDLRIAARSARLGLPDAELGFSPTGGLTYLLVRMVGLTRALHMALSAEILTAEEAERIGLVGRVVDDDDLPARAAELAERLCRFPGRGLRNIKRAFHMACDSGFAATLALEQAYDSDCFRSPQTRERLAAFLASHGRGDPLK